MSSSPFDYKTIQLPKERTTITTSSSTKGAHRMAKAKLALKAMNWAMTSSINHKVKRLVNEQAAMITSGIEEYREIHQPGYHVVGAVAEVRLHEWKTQDFMFGTKHVVLKGVKICGVGTDFSEVIRKFENQSRFRENPAQGWVIRTVYLWITPGQLDN